MTRTASPHWVARRTGCQSRPVAWIFGPVMINRFIIRGRRADDCKVLAGNVLSPVRNFGVPRPRGGPQGLLHCRPRWRLQGASPRTFAGRVRGSSNRDPAARLPRCPQRGPHRSPGRRPANACPHRPPGGHRSGLGSAVPGASTPPGAISSASGSALHSAICNPQSAFVFVLFVPLWLLPPGRGHEDDRRRDGPPCRGHDPGFGGPKAGHVPLPPRRVMSLQSRGRAEARPLGCSLLSASAG